MTYAQAAREIIGLIEGEGEEGRLSDSEIVRKTAEIVRAAWDVEEKPRDVLHISEDGGPATWSKIGCAFLNRDGSLNVALDAIPINGRMHIRHRPKEVAK